MGFVDARSFRVGGLLAWEGLCFSHFDMDLTHVLHLRCLSYVAKFWLDVCSITTAGCSGRDIF